MDVVNMVFEFFTGAPVDPEIVLDYAAQGNISGIRQILRWYPEKVWTLKNERGLNVLNIALENHDLELVRFCVVNGSPIRYKEIRYALEHGMKDIIKVLVECQNVSVVSFVDRDTMTTPLIKALEIGDIESAQCIMRNCTGNQLNQKTKSGETALSLMIKGRHYRLLAELLSKSGKELRLHRANDKGWTALHLAAERGQYKVIRTLLKLGANPNATTFHGKSPLHIAAECGFHKCITQLLKRAEGVIVVECRDVFGNLPHHYFLKSFKTAREKQERSKKEKKNLKESSGSIFEDIPLGNSDIEETEKIDPIPLEIEEFKNSENLEKFSTEKFSTLKKYSSSGEEFSAEGKIPLEGAIRLPSRVLRNFKLLLETELKNRKNKKKSCYSLLVRNKLGESVFEMAKQFPELMEMLVEFLPEEIEGMTTIRSFNERTTKNWFRIQICSDFHLEFGHKWESLVIPSAPYLALVGDVSIPTRKISEFRNFLLRQAEKFEKVFFVPGNHEYHNSVYDSCIELMRSVCSSHPNLVFLHRGQYKIHEKNICILGTTLWSHVPPHAKQQCHMRLSDYSKIQIRGEGDSNDPEESDKGKEKESKNEARHIRVDDTNRWHNEELQWLRAAIKNARENHERIIVLTHHSPIFGNGCNNPELWDDETNYAFATDLMDLINVDEDPISLWAYGHTHWFQDMWFYGTHVVSNPHGYPNVGKSQIKNYDFTKDESNPYDPTFVVEIE